MKKILVLALFLTAIALVSMSPLVFAATVTFGNTADGTGGNSILDKLGGTAFTCPVPGTVDSITARIVCNTQAKYMKAAIYDSAYNLIAETEEVSVLSPGGNYVPYWVTFNFASPPSVTAGTTYVLFAWSEMGAGGAAGGSGDLYYTAGVREFLRQDKVYDSWPNPASPYLDPQYETACIYATVTCDPSFVVPEAPFGTIAMSAAMIIALAAYFTMPKWKGKLLRK
jgi:hypothetical protein